MTSPRFLLDTNICIYIINRRPAAVFERFAGLQMGDVGVSSITGAELSFGVAKSGSARNREALEKFLAPLEILAFGESAFRAYGPLRAQLSVPERRSGRSTRLSPHMRCLWAAPW